MRLSKGLRLTVVLSISAVSTATLWLLISSFWALSSLEVVGCFLGVSVIIGTFHWAFRTETSAATEPSTGSSRDELRGAKLSMPDDLDQNPLLRHNPVPAGSEHGPSTDFTFEVPKAEPMAAPGEPIPLRAMSEVSIEFWGIEGSTTKVLISGVEVPDAPALLPDLPSYVERRQDSTVGSVPQSEPLSWCGKGETLHVGPYTIRDPLVYRCRGQKEIGEASCINLRLPVGQPIQEPPGSLGYYPTYERLTSDQRANYLQWLAEGRSGSLGDIGYAFLFFYGLEWRLLVEGQDLSPIVKEAVRLLETYDFSGSFDGYVSRFLSYSLAKSDISTLKEKWFQAVFEKTRAQRDEQHLAVGLAWLFAQHRPLPVNWAMRLARLDPRSPRSVVLERLPEQFRTLFAKRYAEKFGEGLLLRAAKRDREVVYRPASPSMLEQIHARNYFEPVRVPNILGIQSQFAPLIPIWTSCIEELKPLSRVMARGAEVTTRAAYDALPENLKADTEHPDKPLWEKLSAEHAREDGTVVVEVGSVARIHGIDERPKLTAKQSGSLASTAHEVGFVIEPDFRLTGQPYRWGDQVALFRPEERPTLPTDGRYSGAALMLELGMFVAAADGEIEGTEVDHIASFLESQFLLDPPDVRRLEALKQVFLGQHPSLSGIGKRLKVTLSSEQLESVGQFLVGVAAANGSIEKKEVSALRSAYRALGIEAKTLDRLLEDYRRTGTEPVEVQSVTVSAATGEAIPPRPENGTRAVFKLDAVLLERLMSETRQVATLLDEAMQEDSEGQSAEQTPTEEESKDECPAPASGSKFDGLEKRHSQVLADLCARPAWLRSDFEELVRRHSLMPSGAMDRINEWAQDCFNDLILEEDGDQLIVHIGLLTEEI